MESISQIIMEIPKPLALSENLIAIKNAIEVKIKVSAKPITSKVIIDLNPMKENPLIIIPRKVPVKNPDANGMELPRYNPINNDFLFIGWQSTI